MIYRVSNIRRRVTQPLQQRFYAFVAGISDRITSRLVRKQTNDIEFNIWRVPVEKGFGKWLQFSWHKIVVAILA